MFQASLNASVQNIAENRQKYPTFKKFWGQNLAIFMHIFGYILVPSGIRTHLKHFFFFAETNLKTTKNAAKVFANIFKLTVTVETLSGPK